MKFQLRIPIAIVVCLSACDRSETEHNASVTLIEQHNGRYEVEKSVDSKTATVTTVNFGGSKTITDDALLKLGTLTRLRHLRLNGAPKSFGGSGLAVLAKMPELETLDLGHCYGITEEALGHLSGSINLRSLMLQESTAVGKGEALVHLKSLTSLRVLDLAYSLSLEDQYLQPLATLSSLQELNLMRCAKIGDAAMAHLAHLTSLQKLNLAGTRITDAGLQQLHSLKKLQSLTLAGTHPTQQTVQCSDVAISALRTAVPGIQIIH